MPNTEMPAGTAGGPVALPDLPEKLRVHALARLIGRTSREVLAALADLDIEVRGAQSSIDRAAAEKVAASLQPAAASAPPAEAPPAPAAAASPAVEAPAPEQAPVAEPSARPRRRRATRASGAGSRSDAAPADSAAVPASPASAEPAAAEPLPAEPASEPFASAGGAAPVFPPTGFEPPPLPPRSSAPSDSALAPLFAPPAPVFQPPARPARTRRRAAEPVVEEPAEDAAPAPEESGAPTGDPGAEAPAEPTAETAEAPSVGGDAADDDEDDSRRRRRRGRRGRGRGKGGDDETGETDEPAEGTADGAAGAGDDPADENADENAGGTTDAAEEDDDEDGDDDESRPSGSRRRRRRRRRSGSGEDGDDARGDAREDDPPATVTRVRAPRERERDRDRSEESGDGVQGVRGSTRLEAKRQRRRDGRDAGRRRVPILSESEFLARREAVDRTMVIRERGDRVEIGVLEDEVLVEHFVADSQSSGGTGPSMVGNIYLGRVQNVLPSMEAAFVDIGRGRNAVLYAGEVDWDAAGLGGKARRIEQALSSGDPVLVQVTKDPVGHKGARLTTQISLAGRFLVYVPSGGAAGISRKLPDIERKRLKDVLKEIVPAEAGVIIRTASEGVSHEALERDVRRLQAQWEVVKAKAEVTGPAKPKAPVLLYEEPDLLIKVVRDQFNEDFTSLVVQGDDAWDTLHGYLSHVAPELAPRMHRHVGPKDVFVEHRIDEQLLKALDRKVWLPSGGTLVIDRTEAMTVVDVNTGKYTGSGGNLEETVTRNNLEAAEEVVRQLRLRDIGGIIVIDFIDMVLESNRDLVLRRLTECLSRDRTRHQVAEVTSLGLVQMTRKRVGGGLLEHFSTPCEHCRGRGVVVDVEGPADIVREPSRGDAGRRSRGGRGRRGENGHDGAPTTADAPPAPVVVPVPAPSPVVLAPAAAAPAAAEPVLPDAPAHDPALDVGAPAVAPAPAPAVVDDRPGAAAEAVEEAVVERAVSRRRRVTRPTTPAAAAPAEPAAVEPAAVEPPAAPVEVAAPAESAVPADAAPAPVVDPVADAPVDADRNGHQARPARRRGRVTRTAGAPAVEAPAAVVLTVPADPAPAVAPAAPAAVEPPEPAPATTRARRPRRTASRPAGPPPAGEGPDPV